jgi:valyl-tRNA synthetase
MAVPGTDIPFSPDRMKGYSAFANKAWNAARFVLMNLRDDDEAAQAAAVEDMIKTNRDDMPLEDLWILHRMNQTAAEISEALDKFRFHEASALIYKFIWHELCDWYIELVKPVLTNPEAAPEVRTPRIKVLLHVFDCALRMLHPFMPFITEEIWQKLPHNGESVMTQPFPQFREAFDNPAAAGKMQDFMELIGDIRSLRAEMNIDPKRRMDACLIVREQEDRGIIERNMPHLLALARLNRVDFCEVVTGGWLSGVSKMGSFGIDVRGAIDIGAERARIEKEMAKLEGDIDKVLKKISSHEFVARAPKEIVEENRARYDEMTEKYRKLEINLKRLLSAQS